MKKQKNIIIAILILVILLLIIVIIDATPFYYDLKLYYDKGDINVDYVKVRFSQYELGNFFNKNLFIVYSLKIFDNKGNVLNKSFFSIPNKVFYDNIDEETGLTNGGGVLESENATFNIYIPYYENAKEVVIYNENEQEVVKRDISEYSKGIELAKEIKEKKLKEIGESGDEFEERDKVEKQEREFENYELILGIILGILIIVFVYFLLKNKKFIKNFY